MVEIFGNPAIPRGSVPQLAVPIWNIPLYASLACRHARDFRQEDDYDAAVKPNIAA
jgi:hypothetical protein